MNRADYDEKAFELASSQAWVKTAALPLGRAAIWRPQEIDGPREAGFVHLALWLVETFGPRRVVRLGLSEAQSFFALCSASDVVGSGIECRGYARNSDSGFGRAAHRADGDADRFEVSDGDPVAALDRIEDGHIDLLSVDAWLPATTLEDIGSKMWRKLSHDGMILIAGITNESEARLVGRMLGVPKHSCGRWSVMDANGRIGLVLFPDPGQSPEARFGKDMADVLAAALARCGDGPVFSWAAKEAEVRLDQAEAELKEMNLARNERHEAQAMAFPQRPDENGDRSQLEVEVRKLREASEASERATSMRFEEIAALTSKLMSVEKERDHWKSECRSLGGGRGPDGKMRSGMKATAYGASKGDPIRKRVVSKVRSAFRKWRAR